MDQLMWIVTFAALTLAVGMSMIAARLLRGDRRRSAARVAALERAAFEDDSVFESEAPVTADAADVYDEPAFDDYREPSAALFAAPDEPQAPSRRWLALAAVALLIAGVIGTAYALFRPALLDASAAALASTATAPRNDAARQTPPIELLSLKHTVDDSTFAVAGLVQNPMTGAPLTRVIAVVYLFDKDGAYFATGRADLEFTGLRPGEESPFTITIAHAGDIGRYRVGFRRDDGSVIAHVDKRGQTASLMTEGKNP